MYVKKYRQHSNVSFLNSSNAFPPKFTHNTSTSTLVVARLVHIITPLHYRSNNVIILCKCTQFSFHCSHCRVCHGIFTLVFLSNINLSVSRNDLICNCYFFSCPRILCIEHKKLNVRTCHANNEC